MQKAILTETPTLAGQFATAIRKASSELWNGRYTRPGFVSRMNRIIEEWLTKAWFQGMKDVGAKPDEISDKERQVLAQIIIANQRQVQGLANFIFMNNRGRGGRWRIISNRISLWANAYNNTRNRAKTMTKGDPKLEWILGPTEEHCQSCSKLAGKVKRASYWAKANIFPQNPPNDRLECGGWRCRCELQPTEKRMSSGRLPGER